MRIKMALALCFVAIVALFAVVMLFASSRNTNLSLISSMGQYSHDAKNFHHSGVLVVYTTKREKFLRPIVEGFEAKTGIWVVVVQAGAGELTNRISAEAGRPVGDIMWGGLLSTVAPSRHLFEKYISANEPFVREHFRNVEGMLTRFSNSGSVLIVNTDFIGDIPVRGYADLLNPKLKGKIAIADPAASSSAFEHLVNKLYAMGDGNPDAGWGFVEALMENAGGKILPSSSAVTRDVARGDFLVGLTFEEGPMPYLEAGDPVKIVYMDEGVIFNPNGIFVVKNARNIENAKLFVDYVTSYEIQSYMEKNLHRRSVRADVAVTDGPLIPTCNINIIYDDADYVLANRSAWLERFRNILDAK